MTEHYIPIDSSGDCGSAESRAAFMMRCLLQSRLDTGLGSDDDGHDHDVNVYLAHLLGSYADPSYCVRVAGYISPNDTTVFETAQHSPSKRFRYRVYRANADHLMMSIGVFDNPDGRRPVSRPHLRPGKSTYVGRAKTYYDFASSYSQSVFGRTSGLTEVLVKLGAGFERYVRILAHLRGQYFDFMDRMSDGELFHLDRASQVEGLQALRDEFLDLYAEYRRTGHADVQCKLRAVAERLRKLDPHFCFDSLQ